MTEQKQRGGQPRTGKISNDRVVVLMDEDETALANRVADATGENRSALIRRLVKGEAKRLGVK